MIRVLRFSPSRLALGYVALSVLALCLFAVPLWSAWRTNLSTFKAYVHGEEMQRLVEVFDREGAKGLAAAMESQAGSLPGGEIMILADPSKLRLAGNLPAWPAQVPDAPGIYGLVIDIGGGATMRVVVSHARLPGGYHLLLGRESVLFQSFIERFWYGIAGAMAIVLVLGAAIGWLIRRALLSEVHEISRTASAIVEGDLSRRLEARSGSPELDTLARTVNGMLAQLGRQNVQLEGEVAVRRQAQQALHRAHDELEGVIVERTAQLAHANESLRLSEQRYERAMLASEAGIWEWTAATDHFYASPRLLEMSGFPPGTTFAGRSDSLLRTPYHPDDLAKWNEATAALFAGKHDRVEMEMRMIRSGETRWVHLDGLCSRDAAGAVARWTGSAIDITERKQAEAALRLSKERYARAMEGAEEGHWEWNLATDEMFLSDRMKEILGIAPGERFASRAEFFLRQPIHPDDRQRVADAREAVLSGATPRYDVEYRVVLREGEVRWVRSRGKLFRDERGAPARMSGSLSDITDRRRGEEALAESEARFRSLTKLSTDFFWETDVADRFTSVEAGKAYRGVRNVAWSKLGKTRWEIPHVSPDEAAWTAHRAVIAARQRFVDFGFSRIENGEERFYEHSGEPRFDAQGRFLGYRGVGRDVTDRKLAEEALRESEERFALAVAGSNEGIFDWDLVTDRVFLSHRAQELSGLEPGEPWRPRDEWSGRVRFHPDDLDRQRRGIRAHLAGETPAYDVEFRMILPGGDCRWFCQRGVALRDASGKAYRMAGSIEDITGRKAAEDEVRQRREELQRLMESVSDYLWSAEVAADGSYCYRYYSPVVERITGWPPEYLLESRERWVGLLHPLDRPWVDEIFRRLISGATERVDVEYRIVRPDGTLRWVRDSAHGTRVEDGRILLDGVVGDITDRKLADEAFRQSEARFRSLTEISSDWYWEQDENLRFTYLSSQADALTGYPGGSSIGKTRWELADMTPLSCSWPEHQAVLAARQPFRDLECSRVGPDGAVRYLSMSGVPIFDEQGRFKGYQGVGRDITERKRLERQLRQSQRLEAMGTLAGGIAHDFNNILGAILGYGEMALRDAPKGGRLRRDLGSIMTAGERGRALVERVLAFSRSGVGERVAVDVEKVVGEALGLLAASLPEGVRIEPRLRAGRAAALGDPTQVHQVLMNLATNAIQATTSGGTVRVSLEGVRLDGAHVATTGTLGAGDYVVLEVADSGTGMSPEILERIFDPFFTTKEVGVGTGLGLSLVHGIVTELGGAIDVASAVGEGSVFTVYLPRAGDAGDELEREEPDVPRGNHQRVLIVDDEAPLVTLATETLAELGYVPVGFTSSAAALEVFRADPGRFDAVITDERMPGMSGSALIREIRGVRRAIPILLVSGYLGGAVVRRALESGADEVLKKPLSARELATSLARVLHARHAEVR